MSDFKEGDWVRVVDPTDFFTGQEGKVYSANKDHVYPFKVKFKGDLTGIYRGKELEAAIAPVEELAKEAPDIPEAVEHPAHYGGADNPYEVIKVAEAWGLDKDAYLFNVIKYVGRAGKKGDTLEDLKKARFYLDRRINLLEPANG